MRVRTSGYLSVGLLLCILVSIAIVPAVAADKTSGLASETLWVQSAPVISEPKPVRIAKAHNTDVMAQTTQNEASNITLDFHAADIADVLKALSLQSGTNIVTGTDVKGQITVSLNHVSLHEALDMITKLSGFRYAEVGPDTYIVGSLPGVAGVMDDESLQTINDAVSVCWADPDELGKLLETQIPGLKFTPGGGKADQPGPKVIVLTGTKSIVDQAKTLVAQIEDTMAEQANSGHVQVYRLKYTKAKDAMDLLTTVIPRLVVSLGPTTNFSDRPPAGVTFMTGSAASGGSGTTGEAKKEEEPTSLVLAGSQEDLALAVKLLDELDVKPKQVLIEAKVTDITLGGQKRLGITWNWTNIGFDEGTKTSGAGNGNFIRLPLSIDGQLDAMLKDNNAKLLANPTVAAIEGKDAVIFIGDEIKYIIRIEETLTGVSFQTETANVGVTLRVIARPDDDGFITLALHPEVSTISDWLTIGTGMGGNNAKTAIALPQIARRFTDHVVRVKDGETIVIGGLIRDYEISNMTKVPLLGDLPFFGGLFRHREKTKEHSDIAIFLKATVMKD